MLCVNYLFRNVHVIERVSVLCKCTSNGKTNVVKSYNTENKILYGRLLETQKQRRKKISKDSKSVGEELTKDSCEELSNQNAESVTTNHKASVKRARTSKVNLHSTASASPINHTVDRGSDVLSSQNVQSELCNSETVKKGARQLKPNNNSEDSQFLSISTDEFVFKSTVIINETNYPLENSTRNCATDSQVNNVLSYNFTDPLIKNYIKFPSVSKIMEETMSEKNKIILNKWRQNMINDLGEEEFIKYSEDLKARGHDFHSAVKATILGKPAIDCSEVTKNALNSLAWLLEHLTNPMAVESITAHPTLGYKGIPDCVAVFRNIPVVVDWKLSDKPKKDLKDTYDAPVQITAYIGALNHDPNYKWGVNHGLVAVAYTSGDPCDVFLLSPKHCQIYWRHWLLRIDKFKVASTKSNLHLHHKIDEKALELK